MVLETMLLPNAYKDDGKEVKIKNLIGAKRNWVEARGMN
jgi:hypothetical protein